MTPAIPPDAPASAYNYEAAALTLLHYQVHHGARTLLDIARLRVKADPARFARAIASRMQVGIYRQLDLDDGQTLADLAHAMARVELGVELPTAMTEPLAAAEAALAKIKVQQERTA